MNREKMMRTAGKIDSVVKAIRVGTLIALILLVILEAALLVVSNMGLEGVSVHLLDAGPLTLELAPEAAPDYWTIVRTSVVVTILGLVGALLVWYALGQLRQILRPMVEGEPFRPEVGGCIRRIAYVSLGLGLVQNIASVVETRNTMNTYALSELLTGGKVLGVTMNYHFEMDFLIVFVVLMLMSYVFSYGAELQRLSDETL